MATKEERLVLRLSHSGDPFVGENGGGNEATVETRITRLPLFLNLQNSYFYRPFQWLNNFHFTHKLRMNRLKYSIHIQSE